MTEISSPPGLITNFQTQLEHQWSRLRELESDDSARGSSYETVLKDLLQLYLSGRFDILSNCSVMDSNLACFDEFGNGAENEVDVVGLFSQASPRIILEEYDISWVPLEGVAFICEVKSRLDKGRLQSDIEKLEKIRNLEQEPEDRFGTKISGDFTIDHQLHCLVYDRSSISDDTLNEILAGNDAWDLVLLVEDDTLIVNQTLPAVRYLQAMAMASQIKNPEDEIDGPRRLIPPGEENASCISLGNGLAWFLLTIPVSIPVPLGVTTAESLLQLILKSTTGVRLGASTSVDENDIAKQIPEDPEDSKKE